MTSKKKQILFIGAGRMAQAIISGLADNDQFVITATNNGNKQRLREVEHTYGISTVDTWKDIIERVDVVVLALPPEGHESLLTELSSHINEQFIITVAAGIDPEYLEAKLPLHTPVAWVMPNTAAELGKSMTLYTCGQYVHDDHKKLLETILHGIGPFEQLTQQQVHQLTPITGSAPAFVYYLAESLVQQALGAGITEEQARKLVAQMIDGSAALLKTGESPKQLADQVATPGGVTAAGLQVFEANGFDKIAEDAICACHDRAKS
ncbi:pyrroline-5-carboxylate reductase [Aquibacillus sediminis]|uniref:pyrroline-5-carboxylate reductase n=1 Tax=Aquibacillus sediminis TaxID=2574734 RepID=UPI001108A401|nr:pyrroline-5-carboxylate reductase [Aquibacillus sediminis]